MPGCNTAPSQHLFLGLSISSISMTGNYGQQSSEVTVQLVNDTDNCGPKVYYDRSLNRQIHTGADPGFIYPRTGSPVYLRLEDFEYTGILQNYEKSESDGGRTWTVKLVSPSLILQNTNVILSGYIGTTSMVANAINVYGAAEELFSADGVACSDAYSGFFGGADVNENGVPWSKIRDCLCALTCAQSVTPSINKYLARGRLAYKGNSDFIPNYSTTPGYGLLFDDGFSSSGQGVCLYAVDLMDLPNNTPANYRFNDNMSLMDLVSQVCDDIGSDFTVELFPLKLSDSIIYKIIKVRRINRNKEPVFVTNQPDKQFDDFITRTETLNGGKKTVISKSAGRELSNDEPTSVLIYGGPKEVAFYFENLRTKMYWGLNSSGNMIREVAVDSEDLEENVDGDTFYVPYQTASLLNSLDNPLLVPATVKIYESELLAAMEGYDNWEAWSSANADAAVGSFASSLANKIQGIFDLRRISGFLVDQLTNFDADAAVPVAPVFPDDFRLGVFGRFNRDVLIDNIQDPANALRDLEKIYEFVKNIADTYYGKKYAIRTPNVCVDTSELDDSKRYSALPCESGWLEDGAGNDSSSIMGLGYPYLSFFSDEESKTTPFVKVRTISEYDVSKLDPSNYIIWGGDLYLKCQIEKEAFVFEDSVNFTGPHVVIEIDYLETKETAQDLKAQTKLLEDQIKRGLDVAGQPALKDKVTKFITALTKNNGSALLNLSIQKRPVMPWNMASVIPFRSNIVTYGPWYYDGAPGLTKVENDTDLVPWSFGSISTMSGAGQYLADNSQVQMQSQDSGSISVYGYPVVNLGRELNYPTLINIDNRVASVASVGSIGYFYVGDPLTNIDFGPVVTSINIEIGQSGYTTRYDMRTYTPKYGKFSRENYERMKNIGLRRAKQQRQMNLLTIQQSGINAKVQRAIKREKLNRRLNPNSPVSVLVGQSYADNNTNVTISKSTELFAEGSEKYVDKSIMSLDGLIRPVQKGSMSDNLPKFATPNGSQNLSWSSREIEGPIKDNPILGGQLFGTSKLDPFMSKNATKFHDGETHHDIMAFASGTELPDYIHDRAKEDESGDGYEREDARVFALRGPVLINGWGLDLDGKPVPNESDIYAEYGQFESYGKKDRYYNNWLENPKSWPTAPLDVRYDRTRGVWTFPGGFKIIRAQMQADLRTFAEAIILENDGPDRFNTEGEKIEEKRIDVYNPFVEDDALDEAFEFIAWQDDIILVYFNSFKNKYYFLNRITESDDNSGNNRIYKFTLTENMDLGDTATATISDPQSPHVNVVVYDPTNEMFRGEIGYDGLCYRIDDELFDATPKYRIIWMEGKARWIHFTLQDMFNGDGVSEGASVNYYCLQGKDPGTTLDIYDLTGRFKYTDTGAQGIALYDDIQDRYVVVSCDDLPFQCMAELKEDLCFSGSVAILNNLDPLTYSFFEIGEYRIQVPNARLPSTALNPFKHTGKKGNKVLLLRSRDTWYVTDVQRQEGMYMQEIVGRTASACLNQKTFRFGYESCYSEVESELPLGELQQIVTDVYLDSEGSPTALMKDTTLVYVVCAGNSVPSEIIDITECP